MTIKIKLNTHKQNAFTLVEVMVAMVIFSVGLLGLAGLQSLGMTSNQTSYFRTLAMQQAYNMSDRMRNNSVGVLPGGNYNAIAGQQGLGTDCMVGPCTPAQLAAFDHFEWNAYNNAILPEGTGTVTNVGGVFTICVLWNELNITVTAATDCTGVVPYNPTNQLKFYALQYTP